MVSPQDIVQTLSPTIIQWVISGFVGFIIFVIVVGIAKALRIKCDFLVYMIAFGVACYFIFLTLTGLNYIVDWNSVTPFPIYTHELNS